jgi:glycosyltransferase involved in cell wall biosynthesis
MRIALNAALAGERATGIGVYATALAAALPAVDGGRHTYDVYLGGLPESTPEGTSGDECERDATEPRVRRWIVRGDGRLRRIWWDGWRAGRVAAVARADLLHSTSAYLPWPAPCPCVLTIHDLAIYRFPEAFPRANRTLGRWLFEASVRRAAALIAVSEATRRDAIDLLGVDSARITAIPEAADPIFRPVRDPAELARVRAAHGLARPYVLSVATTEPRKNLRRLLAACAVCREALGREIELVLVGAKGWLDGPLEEDVRRLAAVGVVRLTGYVPRGDLPALYSGAAVVAYPSLYEGFGLPVLEALACGAPVLTSNRSSLPEVAGDAALLVDPTDYEAIAVGLRTLLEDDALAATLRRRGPARAARFTWEAAARATLAVYARAAGLSEPIRESERPALSVARVGG